MLLADTLSAYLLLPVFFYIFITIYHNKNIGAQETIFLSTLTALGVITSMSTIYGASIIYLFIGYLFIRQKINVPVKKFIAIMAIPYLIFIAYLITTNSTKDFYNQSILYNANTYVKLPDGASFKNPVRVAIVFQYYFFQNFKNAILMVKDLNFSSPFAQALVLGNVSLLIFLVFKRKPLSVLFFWLFLSFASVRGNPYTTTETDYQAILYHLTSLSASIFALFFIWHELSKPQLPANRKAVYTTVLIFNGLFMLFLGLFFFDRWFEKTYQKYAGLAPLIYDRPPLAVILNNLISQQEQYIVYPFNFEDQLYLHSKPASKYIVFLPGMDGNAQIESDVIKSIKTQKPPVIVFNTELHIYGSQPGKKVFEYVSQNYSNLETLAQTECLTIKSANKILGHSEQTYDFERHIFFLNERKKELLDKLTNLNLIQTQPKSPCSR